VHCVEIFLAGASESRAQHSTIYTINIYIKQELDLLTDEDVIYKLIGPVLIKQDLHDAKQTVKARAKHFQKKMYLNTCCEWCGWIELD